MGKDGISRALLPAAALYRGITGLRGMLFDHGILKETSYPIPVISVGNLAVGGTGKTPMVQYVVQLLHDRYRVAVLSRGYGRTSKGYIIASSGIREEDIGDEPFQIHRRYPDIAVAVSERRRTGMERLLEEYSPQVIILDDAYQHRWVKPSLNVLLTDCSRLFTDDRLMPAGRLRESARGAERADVIVVTKCPDNMTDEEFRTTRGRLAAYGKPVFFTSLSYGPVRQFRLNCPAAPEEGARVVMLTGIANPAPMQRYLSGRGFKVTPLCFPDHHRFKESDIRKIEDLLKKSGEGSVIVTTEKDAARLENVRLSDELASRIVVLPVDTVFRYSGSDFDDIVTRHIESFRKDQTNI